MSYREKLESLGFQAKPKATNTTTVYDEERGGGRVAGYQTEYKDGHVDAVITPPVTDLSARTKIGAVKSERADGSGDISIGMSALQMNGKADR